MSVRRSLLVVGLVFSMSAVAFAVFVQTFETDTAGWFGATRVSSGTRGVPSESGGFHAEDDGGAFTRWGGYSKTFPPGGYITTVDIYLDIIPPYMDSTPLTPYSNDTRFDWTSAVSTPACAHRRDFAFNAGFYTDVDLTGAGPRFVITASNNTGRGNSFPKNPDRDPFTILLEGWYTFEHRFYAVPDMPGGVLRVDLTIKDAATGTPLHTWMLSDPSDIIGKTVGGNRYGWFPNDEFVGGLAFDTSALVGYQDYCELPASTPGAKITGGGWIEAAGGKGTFGLTAQVKGAAATPSGNVTYHDPNRNVKSTSITSVIVSGPCAQIRGMAKVNNSATSIGFEVNACDMGEPGKDQDTFSITMADSYTAGGTLRGGNIQMH